VSSCKWALGSNRNAKRGRGACQDLYAGGDSPDIAIKRKFLASVHGKFPLDRQCLSTTYRAGIEPRNGRLSSLNKS
jgi:hypothetical protein